tara:strand:- start:6831 stop:7415 length:585 start_codon:yes stop_codon:yes gene_type:complete
MLIIHHRRNTKKLLDKTNYNYGLEIDIRSFKNDLVLSHDPYINGESFDEWLKYYNHKFLVLNIKEEGLEEKIFSLMHKYNIKDFFVLDQSFPFLIKTINQGESRVSIRLSEYESINTLLNLSEKVDWVWVDYFTKFPLDKSQYEILKKGGFRICIVSPELQGFPSEELLRLKNFLKYSNIIIDAVCTKYPDLWL